MTDTPYRSKSVQHRIAILGLFLAVALMQAAGPGMAAPGGRHVLIVGISGCRPDAVQAAPATNLHNLARGGAVAWDAYAGGMQGPAGGAMMAKWQPTLSGPGWCSVLTGVWSNKHAVGDNTLNSYNTNYPHFFRRIKEIAPATYLSSIVEWAPLDTQLVAPFGASCDFRQTATDGATTDLVAKAATHLATADPDVLFLQFDAVDQAGSASGYSPTNPAYLGAIVQVDAGVGQILAALTNRATYATEEWLVLMTSDHGGTNQTTGGQSAGERTIAAMAQGPGIVPASIVFPGPAQTFLPPTVMTWLGLAINPQWGFEAPIFGLPTTTNLEVYLNLDDTLAPAAGTTHTAVVVLGSARYANGVVGSAALFTNSDALVSRDWYARLNRTEVDWIYSNDFTLAMWVRVTNNIGIDPDGAFAGNKDWATGGNVGWVVAKYNNSVNWCTAVGPRRDVRLQPAGLINSNWHQVTVSFLRSANRVTTYFNGVAFATNTVDSTTGLASLYTGYHTLIGASGPGTYGVNGQVDEFAIWSRALSDGEATELYYRGLIGQALTNRCWPAPAIVTQPASTNVDFGHTATFHVSFTGLFASCYWTFNGFEIAGSTSTTYSIAYARPAHTGDYRAIIFNSGGAVTSDAAVLSVNPRPTGDVTNGLAVHLKLDGNLAAAAGTTASGTVFAGTARYVPGIIGQAASFSNDAASLTGPSDWAATLGNLEAIYSSNCTLSLWCRTTKDDQGVLMGNKNWSSGANIGWVFTCWDDVVVGKQVNFNTAPKDDLLRRDFDLNPPMCNGSWHLVALVLDRTTNWAGVYLDGDLYGTNSIGVNGTNSLNAGWETLLGACGTSNYACTADIDDVKMWGRALSAYDIATAYYDGLENPTAVTLVGLRLKEDAGRVQVCWQTATEFNTLGFNVYRRDHGAWLKINASLVAAQGWPQGGIGADYCLDDAGAEPEREYQYLLEEMETTGETLTYGPYTVEAGAFCIRAARDEASGLLVKWPSRSGETYDIYWTADLRSPFMLLEAGIPAQPPQNAHSVASPGFYRVRAR